MDFGEWHKFCLNSNIIPHVIGAEESKQIFKIIAWESVEKAKTEDPNMNRDAKFDYEIWLRGLVRILILAK